MYYISKHYAYSILNIYVCVSIANALAMFVLVMTKVHILDDTGIIYYMIYDECKSCQWSNFLSQMIYTVAYISYMYL